MDIIIATDKEWNIGKENQLLAKLPLDMARFKKITTGNIVIMGRKTFDSLPNGPLKDRYNVVITSKSESLPKEVFAYDSIESFLEDINQFTLNNFAKGWFPHLYVIGGGNLIEQLLPYCEQALVTEIDHVFQDADTKMPDLKALGWKKVLESEPIKQEDYQYRYLLYKK